MKITLPLPPSINRTYRTDRDGNFFKSHQSHAWEDEALYLLMPYKKFGKFNRCTVVMDLFFYRDSDIDSRTKAVLDVLQKSGIIDNDMNVLALSTVKHIDKKNPRVEIHIADV